MNPKDASSDKVKPIRSNVVVGEDLKQSFLDTVALSYDQAAERGTVAGLVFCIVNQDAGYHSRYVVADEFEQVASLYHARALFGMQHDAHTLQQQADPED